MIVAFVINTGRRHRARGKIAELRKSARQIFSAIEDSSSEIVCGLYNAP